MTKAAHNSGSQSVATPGLKTLGRGLVSTADAAKWVFPRTHSNSTGHGLAGPQPGGYPAGPDPNRLITSYNEIAPTPSLWLDTDLYQ